jgi:hypothetical protein
MTDEGAAEMDQVRFDAVARATAALAHLEPTRGWQAEATAAIDASGLLEENQRLRELLNTGGKVRIKKGKDKLWYGTKIAVNGEPTWTTEGLHNLVHVRALAENDWPGVEVVVEE